MAEEVTNPEDMLEGVVYKFVGDRYVPLSEPELAQRDADAQAWLIEKAKVNSVTPYQARVALLQADLLSTVEALMANPNTPQAAKIAWEYATVFQRDSAFIATLGPALGLSEQDIDALFISASQIS